MAVDSISGGAGIFPSAGTGDVSIDFDAPDDLSLPGSPLLGNPVSTALPAGSQRIASVAYVRAAITQFASGSFTPPAGPIVVSNGTVLGSLSLSSDFSITGTFPTQTLNIVGGPGGPAKAEDVSLDPATPIPVTITEVQAAVEDIYERAVFLVNGGGGGPGPPQPPSGVDTVDDSVTANMTTPTPMTAQLNVVNGDGGVRLPAAIPGGHCFVRNDNVNPIEIYPAVGARINNRAVGEAADLISDSTIFFKAVSTTRWVTVP